MAHLRQCYRQAACAARTWEGHGMQSPAKSKPLTSTREPELLRSGKGTNAQPPGTVPLQITLEPEQSRSE